ncbi:MAG: sensor histidine kinase [Roseburia sp.]
MNTINKFFKKYLWKSILILILFLVLNLVFGIGFLTAMKNHTIDAEKEVSKIAEGIRQNDLKQISIDENTRALLSEKDSWAMILDEGGNVVWDYHMPKDIPQYYSVSDVAKFSRWYLEDYPVLVQELSFGLLVVGYQPDNILGSSMIKLHYVTDSGFIKVVFIGGILLVLVNIVVVVLLFWNNTRKVEKEIVPILCGIEEISHGGAVSLPEKGELANINIELNHASQYIMKKDKARADWINGISHDLRTPLSMIMGYAGEIEEDELIFFETRKQAGIIRSQAEKIKKLIADLNLVSKLEYSMQPLRIESVDLMELGRQVVVEFLNDGLEEKYEIDYDISEILQEPLLIEGDAFLLKRMLANLIQNSISHNPQGCHIVLAIRDTGKEWEYSVSDNGIGVQQEKIEQLNRGVISGEDYLDNGETSHGYGLKLVRHIVEAHRGRIFFKSNVPQGLCVEIFLEHMNDLETKLSESVKKKSVDN